MARVPDDLPAEDVQAFLVKLCVTPTFTAHPTESRRRTVLDILARLGEVVRMGDERPLTREERESRESRILEAITLLWQTEEVRPRRPTVLDEVQTVLTIVGPSIFAVAPALHRELTRVFKQRYPNGRLRLGKVVEVHSWVGGDRDGNPNVTPDITRQTIARHRAVALTGYQRRVDQLAQDLSVASTRALITHELANLTSGRCERVARDRRRTGAPRPNRAVSSEAGVHLGAIAAHAGCCLGCAGGAAGHVRQRR